jgi:hypothetical protein
MRANASRADPREERGDRASAGATPAPAELTANREAGSMLGAPGSSLRFPGGGGRAPTRLSQEISHVVQPPRTTDATEPGVRDLEQTAAGFAAGHARAAPAGEGSPPPDAGPPPNGNASLPGAGLGAGAPLPDPIREEFEPALDADLSGVRVHTGPAAARAARDRAARAFTIGQHIVFGEGRYAPWTPDGRSLLAHELAHTVQQRTMPATVLTAPLDEGTEIQGPVTVRYWLKRGLIGATLNGRPWVTVRWDPDPGRTSFEIGITTDRLGGLLATDKPAIGLRVSTRFPIKVIVSLEAEHRLAESTPGTLRFMHDYSAGGHPVVVNEELLGGLKTKTGDRYFSVRDDYAFDLVYNVESGTWDKVPVRGIVPTGPFAWRFENRSQLDAWAAAHPDLWWVEGPPDGSTLQAMHADEKAMQTRTARWRDEGRIEEVRTVYEKGVAWASPDALWDLFYASEYSAQAGPPGDAGECLVFKHNHDSFGRVPLGHPEALAAWTQLETDAAPQLAAQLPRGTLAFVAARGESKDVHLIGAEYLARRTAFLDGLAAGRDPSELLAEPMIWAGYLRIALDRQRNDTDPVLRATNDMTPGVWEAAGARALDDMATQAKWEGIWAAEAGMNGVGPYRHEETVRQLVLWSAGKTREDARNTASFLGIEEGQVDKVAGVLADRVTAARIWMGEEVNGVSTDTLQAAATKQYFEFQKLQLAIQIGDVDPLWDPGQFGQRIRERVFPKFGFTLSARDFPGKNVASPYTGFGSQLGQAFAKGAETERSRRRRRKYFLIGLAILASVVLILVANAAGAALAGWLITQGTAGFVLVELLTAATIVTALGPAVNTLVMSEGKADFESIKAAYGGLGGVGKEFAWNFATFGFFKALGWGVRAATKAGAGGAEAFEKSLPWRSADVGLRVEYSALGMYGAAALRRHLEGKPMPTGEAANEHMFEMGLSLLLMELGGFATRGMMKDVQTWARDQRLGVNKGRMDALLRQSRVLGQRIAEYAADPHSKPAMGDALLKSQLEFLKAQEALIADLRQSFRTRADAKQLEARLDAFSAPIRARIEGVEGYQQIAEAQVRPVSLQEGNTAFTYLRGKQKLIVEYWSRAKATVRVEGDVIYVKDGGRELTYRPATDTAAGIRPDGTRVPQALEAWRADLARQRLTLLADAAARGHFSADIEAVRDANPATVDPADLPALQRAIARVTAKLQPMVPQEVGWTDKLGTDSMGWRQRLLDAKKLVLARAKALGMDSDPAVAKLREKTGNLSRAKYDNTLTEYQRIVEAARAAVDKQVVDVQALAKGAAGGPPTEALKASLVARQAEVRRRAEIYGASERKYVRAAARVRPGTRGEYEGLVGAEEVIAAAEAKLDVLSRRALAEAEATHGKAVIDAVRADPTFELWTDAQVGDALRAFGGRRNVKGFIFTPEALRGALWAARGPDPGTGRTPIPMSQLVSFARSPQELTFVLETYGRLRDLSVEGSFDVIRRAAGSRDFWKGAVWQLWTVRMEFGLNQVRGLEVKGDGREIDVLLRDGRRVECKDWPPSAWNDVKVANQVTADFEGATQGGRNPNGIKDVLWIFRPPGPRTPETIRDTMRAAFDAWIAQKGATLSPKQVAALQVAFEAHTELVRISPPAGADIVLPPPLRASGVPVPVKDDDPDRPGVPARQPVPVP